MVKKSRRDSLVVITSVCQSVFGRGVKRNVEYTKLQQNPKQVLAGVLVYMEQVSDEILGT